MKNDTITLTRRIQLMIDLPTQEEREEAKKKLYQWRYRCHKAANLIVSHLYVQEMIQEFFYLSEGVKYKLVDKKKDELGLFNRSRMNTTYRMVSDRYKGKMPTNILSQLNNSIQSSFKKNREEYWRGERSLHNFKKEMAFPFTMEGVCGLEFNPEKSAFCFKFFSIPVKTYLGRAINDKWRLMHQLTKGEIKMRTSYLKLKDGKIFMMAAFEIEKEKHRLRPEVVAEASLSLEYPIMVKIGKAKLSIGSREEFLYRRLAIQAACQRTREGVKYARSGNGSKRKTKAVARFKDKERNYVNQRLHKYSRELIDFCVKHQAGTLILVDQEQKIELAKEEAFVLRNWNYYDLMTKIKYKAEKAGIELIIG
jgi:IS605 OrfB family transposase